MKAAKPEDKPQSLHASFDGWPEIVAVVPARGGSRGVHRKNMRTVMGKPLLAHTIEAAQQAHCVKSVFVSSDDAEILSLGAKMGCCVIERPSDLATDTASAVDVVDHFIAHSSPASHGRYIAYLQPTSPLRRAHHIDEAAALLIAKGADSVVSVVELNKSPYKSFSLNAEGRLCSLFDERLSNARRQDLPATYIPNGAIYIFSQISFVERHGFPSNGSFPYVMSPEDSVDIDTEDDIVRVEQRWRQKDADI